MDAILLDAIEYNGGGIKQVIRGCKEFTHTSPATPVIIDIGKVDPTKCAVFCRARRKPDTGSSKYDEINIESIEVQEDKLIVTPYQAGMQAYQIPSLVDWQLIEGK